MTWTNYQGKFLASPIPLEGTLPVLEQCAKNRVKCLANINHVCSFASTSSYKENPEHSGKRKRSTDTGSDDGESEDYPSNYDESDELPSDYISSDDDDAIVEIMMYSMSQKDEEDSRMWDEFKLEGDDELSLADFTSEAGSEAGDADDEAVKSEDQDLDTQDEDLTTEDEAPEFEDEDIDSGMEDFYLKEEAVQEEEEAALLVEAVVETSQVDSSTQPQPVFSSNDRIGLLKTTILRLIAVKVSSFIISYIFVTMLTYLHYNRQR